MFNTSAREKSHNAVPIAKYGCNPIQLIVEKSMLIFFMYVTDTIPIIK